MSPSQNVVEVLEKYRKLRLSDPDQIRQRYKDKPITFQRLYNPGMRWPKPIKQFFADAWQETSSRIIGKANRGGGKTQVLGALGFSKFYFQGRNIVNMGGSMVQAQNVYDRFREHCYIDESIYGSFPTEPLMSITKSDKGNYYKAIAASARQARGPHPDALFIDEVAEANDEIVESAMPMVNTSENSMIVMTSTFHKVFGIFQETWDNADTLGYQRHSWDAVDVARQFSPDIWKDAELRKTVPDLDKLEERFRGRTGDPEGWIPVGNIIQAWREKRTINWFDVEYMGLRPSSQGLVLDPEHVEDATVPHDEWTYSYDFPAVVIAGLDWGFSSMTAFVALMQTVNGVKAQIDSKWWTETELGDENKPGTIISDICTSVKANGIRILYADSAGKFENVALRAAFGRLHIECKVIEVPFSTEKEWMLGNYKAHFEQRKILIPSSDMLALWQHKRYRYQPNSDKPLKKDDHFPDATMLCMKHWPLGRDIPNTDIVNLDKRIHNAQSTYTGELLDKEF